MGILVAVPFVAFCVLSDLQNVNTSLYEVAEVDGASFWNKLFRITLPLLMPSLMVSTVLNIIYMFHFFPYVWTISKGAPVDMTHTLVTYLYKLSFTNQKVGGGSVRGGLCDPGDLRQHLHGSDLAGGIGGVSDVKKKIPLGLCGAVPLRVRDLHHR